MDLSSKGVARAAWRLGRLGLERLSETRVGERVQELAKSDLPGMDAARFAFGLVRDRVREEALRRLSLPADEHSHVGDEAPPARYSEPRAREEFKDPEVATEAGAPERNAAVAHADSPGKAVRRSRKVEPIETLTMARLLASQGVFDRALTIYDAVLGREPGNDDLRREIADVEARARTAG